MESRIKKKLIEVALPLEAINIASSREKSIHHGHPSSLHTWWARRPLAAARAVIFAQMVDDPSSSPDLFPSEKAQEKERKRLFKIIEDLVKWENTIDEKVLGRATAEIWQSWRRSCAENADHPDAKELFDRSKLPAFHDPFAGGGAIPLEAQRLGLETNASDLNPVAVLLNKAMIEIPPKFSGIPPVNPDIRKKKDLFEVKWKGAEGLGEDVSYYGKWLSDEAEKRIGNLYPKVDITSSVVKERPDLKKYSGKKLPVIAWLWARTVISPNPSLGGTEVPLVSNFMLSTQPGKEAYVEPYIENKNYQFKVKIGIPKNIETVENGTKLSRANFKCLISGVPISGDYIKSEGQAGRMNIRLMAIVAECEGKRIYLSPLSDHENFIKNAKPDWKPEELISGTTQYIGVKPYGVDQFFKLFTNRQLVALTTFSDLVIEVKDMIRKDAIASGLFKEDKNLVAGGIGATAYSEAICVYLSLSISKETAFLSTQARWRTGEGKSAPGFGRQAIPMVWDFADLNPFAGAGGDFKGLIEGTKKCILNIIPSSGGTSQQEDAATQQITLNKIVSTDPPYYDNVPYADLSDYFYVWLRHTLRSIFPDLFSTVLVPKKEELVAFSYRHVNKEGAEKFFLHGMTRAMGQIAKQAHVGFPITIYYAFKQAETDSEEGTSSTGWVTFLEAVIRAGFSITGTWPMRTEGNSRLRGMNSNALASSIVLVCRPREVDAPITTRRKFIDALKTEMPLAIAHLQRGNIAPVDLAQAAIGPGMGIYTRYSKVLDASGNELSIREALSQINEVLDETLAQQEGDFDSDTRWALTWFDQYGFSENEYGIAEKLSKAKNTSVAGMVEAGILSSNKGKVRLLKPDELINDWDPDTDTRLTSWETVHHLIRVLGIGGEPAAAELVKKLGSKGELARELAYRLYTVCERKKRAKEALSYNALVQSWPEITRLAQENIKTPETQIDAFN